MAGTQNKVAGVVRQYDSSATFYDPHGFGLELIQAMIFWGENPDSNATPLSPAVTSQIRVVRQNDRACTTMQKIWVAAPDDVWDMGELAYQCEVEVAHDGSKQDGGGA